MTGQQAAGRPQEPQDVVGVVGMGVMGAGLARNLARTGRRVVVYDLVRSTVNAFLATHGDEGDFGGSRSLEELVESLAAPRTVLVMVPAGTATDAVVDGLADLLDPGDVVIDGGNAHFADTRRRAARLAGLGVQLVGAGISGGRVGALHGPSIMPGCSIEAYERVGPILESIAARADGTPCCARVGPDGAGHFVKMVHNGIEYGVMQLLSEAYQVLRDVAGLSPGRISALFTEWNDAELGSYLLEITADVVGHVDPVTGRPFLDVISDVAEQLGTGRWTAQEALDLGVPANLVGEAVNVRSLSERVALRAAMQTLPPSAPRTETSAGRDALVGAIRRALHGAMVVAYAQGFDIVESASTRYGWEVDRCVLARIWRRGCVVRSRLLDEIERVLTGSVPSGSILLDKSLVRIVDEADGAWRDVVVAATVARVPVLAFSSALGYLDSLRSPRLATTVVQAQRDHMGDHLYRRTDRDGVFNTRWDGDRAEVEVRR